MDAQTPVKGNRGRRQPRRWLPYFGAALLVGLIVFGLWPRPATVETGNAIVGPLRTTINEEGKTRIRQRYTVAATVSGQVRRIPFKAGATVISNETIVAIIDPLPASMLDPRARALAEARRDTARANLERARAAHDFAASELKRSEKLRTDKTISPQELENAQWREVSAVKDLAAAESALREAEAELIDGGSTASGGRSREPVIIKAPSSGRVLRVMDESSRPVSTGTPLLEIGDPTDIEVVVEVLSRDGAAIHPGMPVEMDQWGGGLPLDGRVRYVEPAAFTKVSALGVEEQRVNVVTDILSPAAMRQTVGDNFRVEARIVVWQTNATLKVPSGALFRRNGELVAFVLRNGRAELATVKAGRSSGAETEVLDGLKAGDDVIVYPGDRVRNGMRVIPLRLAR